jgi:hypothetical protein
MAGLGKGLLEVLFYRTQDLVKDLKTLVKNRGQWKLAPKAEQRDPGDKVKVLAHSQQS